MLLEVVHHTCYDYAAPVSLAHHLAHLQPLGDAHQALLAFDLDVQPPPSTCRDSIDAMGNVQHHFSLATPHTRLTVRALSRVRLQPRFHALQPAASPPWDALAARLRYVALAPFEPAVEFALPSPYVPRLPELRAWAAPSFAPGRPLAEAAIELMQRVHDEFRYESRSTEVDTPLAKVFAQRRGVCQDFAHLMIACLRSLGIPCRYVSGYIMTVPAPGRPRLVGADASHAWVSVYCPSIGWVDFDPTNRCMVNLEHVTLGWGRDFSDVTLLRGVMLGGGAQTLEVSVTVTPLDEQVAPVPSAGQVR